MAVVAAIAVSGLAGAETVQRDSLRVSFDGTLAPRQLPRARLAPVAVSLTGRIAATGAVEPPQLERITIAINGHGRLDSAGLPVCRYHEIQPASTKEARAACRGALVGTGVFSASVVLPEQSPFPSDGTVLAFNGVLHGRRVLFAHIYGNRPLPTSFTMPFFLGHRSGTYGTVLKASLPKVGADWGFVNGISLRLHRVYRYRGHRRSYLSASCPAPSGFHAAAFKLAQATFNFSDGRSPVVALVRHCSVR